MVLYLTKTNCIILTLDNVKRSFSDEIENIEISSHRHDERSPTHEDEAPDNNLSLDLGSVSDNSSTSTFDSERLAGTLER